jgi:hypothetical protein
MYRHRQSGKLLLIVLPLAMLPGLVISLSLRAQMGTGAHLTLAISAGIALLVAVLFGSLRVEIDDATLRLAFGIGGPKKRYALADIVSATLTSSTFLEGWGIRITSRGMLDNVSGTDAVEIQLKSGKRFSDRHRRARRTSRGHPGSDSHGIAEHPPRHLKPVTPGRDQKKVREYRRRSSQPSSSIR